jgi:hypothetical protein
MQRRACLCRLSGNGISCVAPILRSMPPSFPAAERSQSNKHRGLIEGGFGEVSITYNDYKTSRMDPPCATGTEEFEVLDDEVDAALLRKIGRRCSRPAA